MNRERHNSMMTALGRTDEHYTPAKVLEVSRRLIGVEQFELDVANNKHNSTNSIRSFTREDNALKQDWTTTSLYCNPPFSLNLKFSEKLVEQLPNIGKAVWLSKCDSRPKWARILIDNCAAVVFKKGYVQFNSDTNAPFGVVLYLFGDIDKDNVKKVCKSTKDYTAFFN